MPKSSVRRKKEHLECADCGLEFKSRSSLNSHACCQDLDTAYEVEVKTEKHPEENGNMFKCDMCSKFFKTNRGCKIHRFRHHKEKKSKEMKISRILPAAQTPDSFTHILQSVHNSREVNSFELVLRNRSPVNVTPRRPPEEVRSPKSLSSSGQKSSNKISASDSESGLFKETPTAQELCAKMYVCSYCPQRFKKLKDYRVHYKTHMANNYVESQTVASLHACPNCPQAFRKVGSYRRHLRSHLNIHSYTCQHCMKSFLRKDLLKSHIQKDHQGEKKYSCALCKNKKFYHRSGLMQHKTEHMVSPPYICSMCGALFPTLTKRNRHLNYHTRKCPICLELATDYDTLAEHMAAAHENVVDCDVPHEASEDSSTSCEDFDELEVESDADSFTSIEDEEVCSVKQHVASKRSVHHVCFICEQRFSKQQSLERHMKLHSIHQCTECPQFFPLKTQLRTHQLKHVKPNDVQSVVVNPELMPTYLPTVSTFNPYVLTPPNTAPEMETSTDFIAWYSNFKKMSEFLKFPVSQDLFRSMTLIVSELGSILYSPSALESKTHESYLKIYQELSSVMAKNAECMKNK